MTRASNRLEVTNLGSAAFGPASLTLRDAECLCLSGPSGVGKTRLLRAIVDLDVHTGEVRLDGVSRDSYRPEDWRRRVALMPPESHWWRNRVGDHFSRMPNSAMDRLALEPALFEQSVSRLSSGERQRFALLRLLMNEPRVLLLDEPTANLDPDNVRRVEEFIRHYRDEARAAVLWVSHDPEQIRRVADRHLQLLGAGQLAPSRETII